MAELDLPEGWEIGKGRSQTLSKRFSFDGYGDTRAFLDRVAELSEERGWHPNISFGTNYANLTIDARDPSGLDAVDVEFAQAIDACETPTQSS